MTAAQLLLGGPVADRVLEDVERRVAALAARSVVVGLGTILVGDDPASHGYVQRKREACARHGLRAQHRHLPAACGPDELLDAVRDFNADPALHAFLIQHPLPEGLDYGAAVAAMDPAKDADGLHPVNLGRLVLQAPAPLPCTPAGIQAMLAHYDVQVAGREVVVVGRGPTLGRPLALLLGTKGPGANAAVTVVHSAVPDIPRFTRRADVVVVAVGVPGFLTARMVRPGAVVVGGGISWSGRRVLSDVDDSVADVAAWVTPRVGGVGPTTVAMLLRNAVAAAERAAATSALSPVP
jgi:methylenetetrahydrofolate dehydrogenase (NADP+) / methenyltetrahydrofolate cyclohydrolase